MGSYNVNRNVEDPFYRYKMPRLVAKVEGKGNGIKTVIANMSDIAKALNRPPIYSTKYFGCELGAQTQFDAKNERYIVNGEHDAMKLQDLLDGFIRKFVLCPACDNPETTLTVKRKEIHQACKACGHAVTIKSAHRLITYIIKNPPTEDGNSTVEATVSTKRKGKKAGTPEDEKEEVGMGENAADDANQNNNGEAMGSSDGDGEWPDDDWPEDHELLTLNGTEEISGAMKALVVSDDLEKPEEERLDMYYNYLTKSLKEVGGVVAKLDGKAVLTEAERLDVKEKATLLICRACFDENILTQVSGAAGLLCRFTSESTRAQKYLLGGLEQLIAKHKDTLLPKVPIILKSFYDADILDEEVILEWGKKASKKYVSREDSKAITSKAEPFLVWLKEAEDETSDESDDGVEFEDEDAKKGKRGAVASVAKKPPASAAETNGTTTAHQNGQAENDEDIDIENI